MATIILSNEAASANAQAINDLLDGGLVRVYTTPTPATADAAETGTLLAELELPSPAFGTPANGVMTANTITDVAAVDTGTAEYWRALGAAENVILQGTCGTSGTSMILNALTITSGGVVSIVAWTYTQPKA